MLRQKNSGLWGGAFASFDDMLQGVLGSMSVHVGSSEEDVDMRKVGHGTWDTRLVTCGCLPGRSALAIQQFCNTCVGWVLNAGRRWKGRAN